jgi:hypothetical protein
MCLLGTGCLPLGVCSHTAARAELLEGQDGTNLTRVQSLEYESVHSACDGLMKLISVFLMCHSALASIRNSGAENKAAKFVFPGLGLEVGR